MELLTLLYEGPYIYDGGFEMQLLLFFKSRSIIYFYRWSR